MAKVIKKEDLAIVLREYEANGEKKKVWRTIGELATFENEDGSQYKKVELYFMPGARISVFAQRSREQAAPTPTEAAPEYPTEDINPEDLPY